jgi:phosphomannomutase
MSIGPELREAIEGWLAEDPDPAGHDELMALLAQVAAGDASSRDELADRFDGTLQFGTAGLRGVMAAGPNRMNRVVVQRAAAGLAAWLLAHRGGAVVVGFDARHKSDVFARDSVEVFTGAGLAGYILDRPLPTPVLAYAIRHLGCAAGVMVTASHNPPMDNGYKVYLGTGAQIVPPVDAEIAAEIAQVGPIGALPRGQEWTVLDDGIVEDYLDAVTALPVVPERDVRVVYTPLHGVGGEVLLRAFAKAGFPAPAVVPAQAEPDPAFPTVSFPNPEEPGAMDLALAEAALQDADLVIANDPDADRCAVAVPLRDGDPGAPGWRMLSGDEVGALLGEHLLASSVRPASGPDTRLMVTTIVSSSLLSKIAAHHGAPFVQSLTGFKWICQASAGVPGEQRLLGYEEALGYCVGRADGVAPVNDKDGVGAALVVASMAAAAKARGRSLLDLLDDLAVRHGLHATRPYTLRVDDLSVIAKGMARLREAPPASLGGADVVSFADLAEGGDGLPPTDGLRFVLAGGGRVVARPSGTEPKLKCYLEVVEPVTGTTREDVAAARLRADVRLDAIVVDLSALLG